MEIWNEALKAFVFLHLDDDPNRLLLEKDRYPQIDVSMAARQIEARRIIRDKLPEWYANEELIFPPHLPLEQCSSEATARWKGDFFSGDTLVDLTGGMGVDCYYLSQRFRQAVYVEQQEELCRLALHNFRALSRPMIEVVQGDSVDYLQSMRPCDLIFIDPARRGNSGNKVILLEECEPDLTQIKSLLLQKAKQVLVKLSPMLDMASALKALPETKTVYIVAHRNECKELLLLLSDTPTEGEPDIHCVNLRKEHIEHFVFTRSEEQSAPCHYADVMASYLYEPNVTLLKAGAFRLLSARYGLEKLHPNTHLYTSDHYVDGFPGRIFEVNSVFSLNKKEVRKALAGIHKANVAVRNFPLSAQALQKRLGLKDGGEHYLFGVTLGADKRVVLTHKIMRY